MPKVLDTPALKSMRDAAATIRAFIFFGTPVVGLVGLAYLALVRGSARTDLLMVAFVAGLIIVAISVAAILYTRSYLEVNRYELAEVEASLLVERIGTHHRYTYRRENLVRARRNNVRLIGFSWYWTGQTANKIQISTTDPDHTLLDGLRTEEDGIRYLWVYVGRAMSKGESLWVGIELVAEDDMSPMRTFFREGGWGYKVRRIDATLRFPRNEEPSSVGTVVQDLRKPKTPMANVDLDPTRTVDEATDTVDFSITVPHPRRGRRYGFRWARR